MLKAPKSIEDHGGLFPYLDATKNIHNGYGSIDWQKNYTKGDAFIRDLFSLKSRQTAYNWRIRRERELKDGK